MKTIIDKKNIKRGIVSDTKNPSFQQAWSIQQGEKQRGMLGKIYGEKVELYQNDI